MKHNRCLQFILTGLIMLAAVGMAETDPNSSENWVLEPYRGNRDQFTLEIPKSWHVFDQSPFSAEGVISFYSQPFVMFVAGDAPDREEQEQKILNSFKDVASGAVPSFLMERSKAGKGMSCAGFSEQAQKKKIKIFQKGPAFGRGANPVGQPEVSNIEFGGCQGLKVRLRATIPGGPDREILAYSTAVDKLTYDFWLVNDAAIIEQNRPWFERIMATVKMTGVE